MLFIHDRRGEDTVALPFVTASPCFLWHSENCWFGLTLHSQLCLMPLLVRLA
jgi:hypothetical protein